MPRLERLFVTTLYRDELASAVEVCLIKELERTCRIIARDDRAGQAWCAKHRYPGYTSYGSLNDLPERDPAFSDLARILDKHVAAFGRSLSFDLKGKKLELSSVWINILEPGGFHSGHIHPNSVISGTLYVSVPKGASAIKFEDPRLAMMMAAPPRLATAASEFQNFVSAVPRPGTLLLWESWLRHEVPANGAKAERVSVSFNYGLLRQTQLTH